MEKELRYLGEQTLFNNYSEEILQIMTEDNNQKQLHKGSVFPIAIDCFGLGAIVGKKLERAKHKISNNEVLKRQKELLLDIEILKLKNNRLEKLVADIKSVASETIEALTIKETPIKTRVVLKIKKTVVNNKEVLAFTKKTYTKA